MDVDTGNTIVIISYGTTVRIESSRPYNMYTCQVSAVTVSQGPFSAPVTVTTAQDGIV